MKPSILAILALVGVHGCTTVEDPFLDGRAETFVEAETGNRELPPHMARAMLTGLGEPPLSVRQTMMEDGINQTIIFANKTTLPGENRLTLSSASSFGTSSRGPDRAEISRALKTEFPGVAMTVDPIIRRNAYGPYGAATGRLGEKGSCVYAWQVIGRAALQGGGAPSAIRLRYCHPRLEPEVLADLLASLSLRSPMAWSQSPTAAAYAYPVATPTMANVARIQTAPAEAAEAPRQPEAADEPQSHSTVVVPLPD
jgi:hypothetical protein